MACGNALFESIRRQPDTLQAGQILFQLTRIRVGAIMRQHDKNMHLYFAT